jgi:hypothetical protein
MLVVVVEKEKELTRKQNPNSSKQKASEYGTRTFRTRKRGEKREDGQGKDRYIF